jgi:hypothetical protein
MGEMHGQYSSWFRPGAAERSREALWRVSVMQQTQLHDSAHDRGWRAGQLSGADCAASGKQRRHG